MDAKDYLKKPYSRVIIPDENGIYFAQILEFQGCYAEGETVTEAIENLERVAESWIEASREIGHEIPEPLESQGYGGKIALRLPKSLHRQAIRVAEREGVSLNQFLVTAIATRLGADNIFESMLNRLEQKISSIIPEKYVFITNTTSEEYLRLRTRVSTENPSGFQLADTIRYYGLRAKTPTGGR
jgi:predicted RNase H-like HicB family nuclease